MSRKRVKIIVPYFLIVSIIVAAILFFFFKSREAVDFKKLRGQSHYNVILITIDTLRADRLGCYGFLPDVTPTVNLFASRGVLFNTAIAQTPLTLPSHATILTGTQPTFHGIRDNGGFVVSDKLQTIAEVFKSAGYETAAFVSAYVLDSKWGLNQGFDYYFDRFDLGRYEKISLADVQRRGDETIDEVISWLEKRKNGKFFTWIHLYDPHTPYSPPEPFNQQFSDRPYLGEIAFTDVQLSRLWNFLETQNLTRNLILVFTSDHGESLGEHGESTHGFFVYQEAIHIPLIFVTPFPRLQGKKIDQIATLADIMPTVCEMVGLKTPSEVQGQNLIPFFSGRKVEENKLAYSETYYPRFHFGWSELRSFQNRRFKLILAPVPELYDLKNDPDETRNLVYLEKKVFEKMNSEAHAFEAQASQNALETEFNKIDEDTRERLAALGYLGSFIDPAKLKGKKLADPKDKISVFNEISRARESGLAGNPEEAVASLKKIIDDDPDIGDAHFALGNVYFKMKKYPEALESFSRSLELKPDDTFAVINITNCYLGLHQPEKAEAFIKDYLKKGFDDPQLHFVLGNLNVYQGRLEKAVEYFEECIKKNPGSASAYNAIAAVYLTLDKIDQAENYLNKAYELNPRLTSVRYNFAQLREKQNRLPEAVEFYKQEIADSPKNYKALYNLARLFRISGRESEELEALKKAIAANPDFPLSYFYLARIYLNRGENYAEALRLVKKGLELNPDQSNLPLGYFLLADLYNRLGDNEKSRAFARKGQTLAGQKTGQK